MAVMEITTNIGCKNNCVYCPQAELIRAYSKRSKTLQMSFDVFKTCIDKIPTIVDIGFAGMSEPWLNPECTKMLLYAHKRGHRVFVNTTLVGMNISDISALETIPFRYFHVHLPSEEGYENIEIDDTYLSVLDNLIRSEIEVTYIIHTKNINSKIKLPIEKNKILYIPLHSRCRNIKIKNNSLPDRRGGVIGCERELRWNILIPSADVLLCCMDYGMRHILGNLITSDYYSLFRSKEYRKVKRALKDESLDIICRYCELYAYNVTLATKIKTYKYYPLQLLRNISHHRLNNSLGFLKGIILKLKDKYLAI